MKQMKSKTEIKLIGVDQNGKPLTPQNCSDLYKFINKDKGITVIQTYPEWVSLHTPKGTYTLGKHETLNYYRAECNGVKVQCTLRKMIGTLRYWV